MVSAFFILLDRSARSVSLLQGPAKHDETNEGIRHGRTSQALFSFGFSRGRSGNQPEPNLSSSGSSEQIRKPSFSKESTSSPLEEDQSSRSQSVTAPSSIPGFNIGRIGARRFLCTVRPVSQKSWSRCWAVDHEAYDQLELIYVSKCVEQRHIRHG